MSKLPLGVDGCQNNINMYDDMRMFHNLML